MFLTVHSIRVYTYTPPHRKLEYLVFKDQTITRMFRDMYQGYQCTTDIGTFVSEKREEGRAGKEDARFSASFQRPISLRRRTPCECRYPKPVSPWRNNAGQSFCRPCMPLVRVNSATTVTFRAIVGVLSRTGSEQAIQLRYTTRADSAGRYFYGSYCRVD